MIFRKTPQKDAFVIEFERIEDERGFFARSFCRKEFEEHGLESLIEQCNISGSLKRGTLRGLHTQLPPHQETKLVRCEKGALYDFILDLRPESPSYLHHFGIELSARNRHMLYIPRGVYHGFITLEDDTAVFYQISHAYAPEFAHGVRWNDPVFGIKLPVEVEVINSRDANYPDYELAGESRS